MQIISINNKSIIFSLLLFFSYKSIWAQNQHYAQFWNEFAFTHSFKNQWSVELDLGQTYTSTEGSKNLFALTSRLNARAWVHHNIGDRWKLSYFFGYYYYKYVPEINQHEYPELRSCIDAMYYIHKVNYVLQTAFKFEDRHIYNNAGYYEGVYRIRTQIKCIYPLNTRGFRQGLIYGIASDELFFKSNAKTTGLTFFDRNRFSIGLGSYLMDNIKVELYYVNDFLTRNPSNLVYNVAQLKVIFNNLFKNIKKKISAHEYNSNAEEGGEN